MNTYSFNPVAIDPLLYPMMADPYDRYIDEGYYLFEHEKIKGYIQQNPKPQHPDGYLIFPYAMALFDESDHHILSAVIEQTDYRILSDLTRTPLSELKGDTKGYLSACSLALYHSEAHQVLQEISRDFSKEDAVELLIDIVCDALDTPFTPRFVGTNGRSR
ncbi:MAG: hypothetical protein PQJ35_02180 [Sphaerochaetaceae bacterium]|nr:hypothetical protein [Sphaerochaetaceae bacterium]